MKKISHLIEIVDVALALELAQGRVLLQRPAVELLVRGDDVDAGLVLKRRGKRFLYFGKF